MTTTEAPYTENLTGSSAAGSTNNAGTTRFAYYTVGANPVDAGCGNKPEWSGLVCAQFPGAQPGVAGLPGLVTKRVTSYDLYGRALVTTETVTDAGGQTKTRTSTVTYDGPGGNAERVKTVAVTGGVGTPVPPVSYGYASSTGLPTTTTTDSSAGAGLAGVITTGYDDFGNQISYTDADGATTTTAYDSADRPATITYKKPDNSTLGTTTIGYDGGTERRGLPTTVTHSGLGGAFTGNYDADGQLTSQTWPDGMTSTWSIDTTGATTALAHVKGGNTFLSNTQISSIHGQWARESGALMPYARDYGYDNAGRLTSVADTSGDPLAPGCVTRLYAFDVNSNRTAKTTHPPAADATCSTTTSPTTINYSYDAAERLQPTGSRSALTYDAFGRITTLPATDTNPSANDGAGDTSLGYYTTDMTRTTAVGTGAGAPTRAWTLDPGQRLRSQTAEAGNQTAAVNHYSADSDSPSWTIDTTSSGQTSHSRYLTDLTGGLAATHTTGAAASTTWALTNLHGDITRTTSPTATLAPDGQINSADEYGVTATKSRYGYLGAHQRANDTVTGLTYMGVRMYAPASGSFLQPDAVLGGGASSYGYPADPINQVDLSGLLTYDRDYDLGATGLPASTYFYVLRNHFSLYFPMKGCGAILEVGETCHLRPYKGWAPVRVRTISTTGWIFDARPGHPDYGGGFIAFDLVKVDGHLRLQIHADVPLALVRFGLLGWQAYKSLAFKKWDRFAQNLRTLVYSMSRR